MTKKSAEKVLAGHMSEFPHPVCRLSIAPQNMSRVFDAADVWPATPGSGPHILPDLV